MKKYLYFIVLAFAMVSCKSAKTLGDAYPKMYEEKPLTIAIMPPINQTSMVEAKENFYTTLQVPLCDKGYYVFSPQMTMEMFQQESAYDAELFLEGDLTPFRKTLGADAVMFTVVKEWDKSKLMGTVTVEIDYILRSTKTGETLYSHHGKLKIETKVKTGAGGWLGLALNMAATAVKTAITDNVIAGRKCNYYVLADIPAGKYSPNHEMDKIAEPLPYSIYTSIK